MGAEAMAKHYQEKSLQLEVDTYKMGLEFLDERLETELKDLIKRTLNPNTGEDVSILKELKGLIDRYNLMVITLNPRKRSDNLALIPEHKFTE